MCGIAGIFHFDSQKHVDPSVLDNMRDILSHRGPDGFGTYINNNIGLAHRRLSIVDLSENGRQPFASADGRYQIIFNGEIYNFKELRPELERKGFKFHSNTDTEVLLYLYISEKEMMLQKLNGMFAFAIWDNEEKQLFIARDRLGVKPFYYSQYDNSLYFASEQKAILNAGVPPTINEGQLGELVQFRFIAGVPTLFKHINKLLPGHFMIVKDGHTRITRWWSLYEKTLEHRNKTIRDPFSWMENMLGSAVQYRMICDVPVGLLLSGGLDSSSIAASLYAQGHDDLSSFTVAFDEEEYNEGNLARMVADAFQFNYHEINLKGNELYQNLKSAAWYHDEPLIHQNDAHMLAISKYAKKFVTVLLSGEAADEIMGGYVRYKPLRYLKYKSLIREASPILKLLMSKRRVDKLSSYFSMKDNRDQVLYNSASIYPGEFAKSGLSFSENTFEYRLSVLKEAEILFPDEPARQSMYLDQHTFLCSLLDRNDRMTMGASIECRVPFLDYRIVEQLSAMPSSLFFKGKKGKHILYNSVGKKLPEKVRQFKKWGFGVPWGKYLRSDVQFVDLLNRMDKSDIMQADIFKKLDIPHLITNYQKGDPSDETMIRQLVMIQMWEESFLKGIHS